MDAVEREDPETQKINKYLINYHFTLSMRHHRGSADAKTSDCTKLCIFSACMFPTMAPLGKTGLQ